MKVFLTTDNPEYMSLIPNGERVKDLSKADIIIFTGGVDVDPALYNESAHYTTSSRPYRDLIEVYYLNVANKMGIPKLGICRGSQFLTVAAGGKLVQDVTHHGIAGTHEIEFSDGSNPIEITSTHHQMMYPYLMDEKEYELIAYAIPRSTAYSMNRRDRLSKIGLEPEIVYYPRLNALCIQGHPERMQAFPETMEKIYSLIETKLDVSIRVLQRERSSSVSMEA